LTRSGVDGVCRKCAGELVDTDVPAHAASDAVAALSERIETVVV
jgi:hypothetical protein